MVNIGETIWKTQEKFENNKISKIENKKVLKKVSNL